ncbi:MAG: hypothetical protein IKX33_08945 [Prevotella sp.]|nr:hypothetical protein [Prevotella sp.]
MQTVISLFLFALAIAYVEYRIKSIQKEGSDDRKGAFDYFATKEELKKSVKKLAEQVFTDRQAVEERLQSIEQKAFFEKPIEKTEQPVQMQKPAPVVDPSVIYFRWPADDGTFADTTKSVAQTEDTYYMFRLDDSRTHAEFSFVTLSDTQLSKANNSSKKYIERACTFTNAKSLQYTCTPGLAHLERGKWVVDQKAKIVYN